MTNASQNTAPDETAVALATTLQQVLAMPAMQASPVLTRLLRYLADAMAPDKAGRLTARQIACEALGQSPKFDAQANSLVRVHVGRLRQLLAEYQAVHGASVPWHLHLPKGQYTLRLVPNHPEATSLPGRRLPALAVLRVNNASGDSRREHFCDLMTLELFHLMSQSPMLRVVLPYTIFPLPTHRGRTMKPQADYALTCSLNFKADNEVSSGQGEFSLTVRLDDLSRQSALWSETYQRKLLIVNLRNVFEEITHQTWALAGVPQVPMESLPKGKMRWKFPDWQWPA